MGGTLAKYAAEGVDVFLLTATRGDSGRYRGHRPGEPQHPGPSALAGIREDRTARRRRGAGCARSLVARLSRSAARPRGPAARRSPPSSDTSGESGPMSSSRSARTAATGIPITSRSPSSRPRPSWPRPTLRVRPMGSTTRGRTQCRSCTTWPGPNRPGAPIRPRFGNWCRRSTASNGRRCRGRTGRSPR